MHDYEKREEHKQSFIDFIVNILLRIPDRRHLQGPLYFQVVRNNSPISQITVT